MTNVEPRQYSDKSIGCFSEWMRNEISKRIRAAGFTVSEWQEEGKTDVYFRGKLLSTRKPTEIFVYHDEVGFLFGDEWVIAENPDLPTRQEMLEWIMKQLFLRLDDAQ